MSLNLTYVHTNLTFRVSRDISHRLHRSPTNNTMRSKNVVLQILLLTFISISSWATPVSLNKSYRRSSLTTKIPSRSKVVQLTSSSTKIYDYEDGEDDTDRLERIKRDLQDKMNGFRPWSVDMTSRRPGKYSITSRIIISNVAMYVLQMIYPSITRNFAKRSDLIMQGKELYRLFTPMFLHGSLSHLLLNSYSTQNIGPEVERLFGGGRFLATYIIGGVVGNLFSAYNTPNPSLGASGAVFGLMGAYYIFLNQNDTLFGRSGQAIMGRVSQTLAMNVLFGMASPSIDNWAHIGGALGGAVFAASFGPKLYLMALPNGGRIIVDKPVLRLPRSIESIPSKFRKRFRRTKRRMLVDRYQSELSSKPWRKPKYNSRPRNRNVRPRRSVLKPLYGE